MEDETARVRSPSGTRLALRRVSFEYSVLRHLPPARISGRADMESEPAGWRAPSRKRVGGRPLRVGPPLSSLGRRAAGAATGFEHPWRSRGRGARHPRLPLATTQPVEGGRSDKAVARSSTPRWPTGRQLNGDSGVLINVN